MRRTLLQAPRYLRQHLLIALLAFMLVGVQLVQASPLHDHVRETVDCALCHLQFSDDAGVQQGLNLPFAVSATPDAVPAPEFYVSSSPSPYQGRAPPPLFPLI